MTKSKDLQKLRSMLAQSPRRLKHVLRAQVFDRASLQELFLIAKYLEAHPVDCLKGKTLVWFAVEPSTRTRFSFSMAARNLGGLVDAISSSDSSQEKGESIEDTIRSIATMGADIIVLRHPDEDAVWRASKVCTVPLINGGSGKDHHPTQALVDVFTILKTVGRLESIEVALVGDLRYGRATNSLAYLLSKFSGITLHLVSPPHLRMKGELVAYLNDKEGIYVHETEDLERILPKVDVLYQTRKQKERTDNPDDHRGLSSYKIDRSAVELMKPTAKILHPLPRNDELSREVDDLPQAVYIKQMEYGVLIRQALLAKILC